MKNMRYDGPFTTRSSEWIGDMTVQGLTLMVVISVTLLAGICSGVQLESSAAQGKRLGEERRRKDPTQKRKTSNTILLALFLLAFIVTMTVTFWVKGAVPDTLIQYTLPGLCVLFCPCIAPAPIQARQARWTVKS